MFWGIAGFTVGLIIALQLAFPALNFDLPWTSFGRLRPLHTSAVIFAFGGNVLIATSFYVVQRTSPRAAGRRSVAVVRRARLQLLHRHRRHRLSARHHPVQGIRRAGMVRRPVADGRVGRLPAGVPRHHDAAHRAAHLRRQLVLSRLHPHHRGAAPRQQRRDPGVAVLAEVLHRLVRRAGCHGAVVVRPQRGRLLPHRRLPRHHVLLHPEARRAAGLHLPAVDHPFLVADLHLHLGRPASPALHGAAGLGADARHDLLDHAVDAVLGRHDQRHHDAVRRLGQAAHRSGAAHDGGLGRLLRHVDLRGADDVGEGGQLAVALHRLDHRPRAFRRARLGRLHLLRRDLLPGAVAVEPAAVFAEARQLALLDLDHRHRALHHRRCGCRASCRA